MKAVIPCARKKDDLYPFTESKPTGLMPVAGSTIVGHLIHQLQEIGVEDIYIIVNHLEEQFEKEFDEYTNVNLVEQENVTGTADALKLCDFIDEEFFVVNGDVIVSENDLANLKHKHENTGSGATMLATQQNKPEKFGVLSITNDRVKSIEEKPEDAENNLVNTGIYLFRPEIFDAVDHTGSSDLTDAVKQFVDNNDARFEIIEDYWIDIDEPRKLWKADQIKREYNITETRIADSAEVHENAAIDGHAVIGEDAVLKSGVVLEGRVHIGESAVIGPNTTVKDSTIGHHSQVRQAVLDDVFCFEENIIDPHVYIEQSIMAEECDTLSGTVIRESFIGPRSFIEMNNSIRGVKFVPDARTDLSEISK